MTTGQFTCRQCGGVFDKAGGRYSHRSGRVCKSCERRNSIERRAAYKAEHGVSYSARRAQAYNARHGVPYNTLLNRANPLRKAWYAARERSRASGLPFSITLHDLAHHIVCPALGVLLKRKTGRGAGPCSPSIDKVVPSMGYVPGNVCVVSYRTNVIKSNATPDEILSVAMYAYTHSGHTLPDIHAKVNEIAQRQVEYAKINAGTETVGSPASVCSVHNNPLKDSTT